MKHFKGSVFSGMAFIAMAIILMTTEVASAALGSGQWKVIASWNVPPASDLTALGEIAANDIWAVGSHGSSDFLTQYTLTEHWDGMTWNLVPSPNVPKALDDKLYAVGGVATNDVWAVGESDDTNSGNHTILTEHWDGTQWSIIPSVTGNQVVYGLVAVASNDVWAVGASVNQQSLKSKTLVIHWNGTTWSTVTSPSVGSFSNVFQSVRAVSANDIWAVGNYSNTNTFSPSKTLIEHWNGTSWSVTASPNVGKSSNDLSAVTPIAPNDVWAAGYSCATYLCANSGKVQTMTQHWNGTSWSVVTSADVGSGSSILLGISAVSSSNVWAVGYSCSTNTCFQPHSAKAQTLVEQWNGTSWNVVSSPNFDVGNNLLIDVVVIPGSSVAWATGYYNDADPLSHPLTECYC